MLKPLLPVRQNVGSMGSQDGEDTGPIIRETQIRNQVTTEKDKPLRWSLYRKVGVGEENPTGRI